MLLLVAVLKYLFIGWRWMVAVRRGRRIGAHHHMCHGNAWVTTCHAVDPEALHTSWLLGNWKDEETVIILNAITQYFSHNRRQCCKEATNWKT